MLVSRLLQTRLRDSIRVLCVRVSASLLATATGNPHCKEAASEIPAPLENDKSTGQEQCKEDAEEDKKDSESIQDVENKGAPELHGTSMVQESVSATGACISYRYHAE
ncbi:hypothetical protein [Raoultella ornithinolytica]|uniref:hypothetical protein n=1 Tax=Raoultella ornithinolytica TaxID=54291 RepID=UPI003D3642E7